MFNAASATGENIVGRKTACTTRTCTRAMLPHDTDIDLNELSPGSEWTFIFTQLTRLQQTNHQWAPSTQDSLYPRIVRPARKTAHTTCTAARGRDNIL